MRRAGTPLVDSASVTQLDEYGRPEPPLLVGEVETLIAFLEFQRATLVWKTSGLDPNGHVDLLRESIDGVTGE
jgi:hypothetical protein